jgi:hypothetical protein
MANWSEPRVFCVGSLSVQICEGNIGAGDRFRTDDLVLGKHTLYQLSYTRPQPFRRAAG